MGASLRHGQRQQAPIAQLESATGTLRRSAIGGEKRPSDRASEQRGNRIANLTKTMPVRGVEPEPVWIRVKTGRLAHGNAPRRVGVHRARRRKRAAITGSARTKGGGETRRIKAKEPTDGIALASAQGGETRALNRPVTRPARASKEAGVEQARVGEVTRHLGQAAQAARVERTSPE